jgi:hypothetical protein
MLLRLANHAHNRVPHRFLVLFLAQIVHITTLALIPLSPRRRALKSRDAPRAWYWSEHVGSTGQALRTIPIASPPPSLDSSCASSHHSALTAGVKKHKKLSNERLSMRILKAVDLNSIQLTCGSPIVSGHNVSVGESRSSKAWISLTSKN